jgi:hypothetical protein
VNASATDREDPRTLPRPPVIGEVLVKGKVPKAPKRAAWGAAAREAWAREAAGCNLCQVVRVADGKVDFVPDKPEPVMGPDDVRMEFRETGYADTESGEPVTVPVAVYVNPRCSPRLVPGATFRLSVEEFWAEGWERP